MDHQRKLKKTATDTAVTFAAPNLEAAIREAINKPEGSIYAPDLQGLTSLSASKRNIGDLTGLECCTDLTELWLSENQISDISPLVSLTNLEEISLDKNPMSSTSIDVYIPQLEERGVNVHW